MNFKEYINKKGLSIAELSKACNIPYATLYNGIENPNKMKVENFNKLSEYLNITLDKLYDLLKKEENITLLSILKDQKESKLKGNIYHYTQIQFAYNTNRIEGSKLTEDETRYIFETNTICTDSNSVNINDILETTNCFYLFDVMLESADKLLTEDLVKSFHRILKNGTSDSRKEWFNVGEYKKLPNTVGNNETTSPKDVSRTMKELLKWYNQIEKISIEEIVEFHHRFESIHPFQDGNGRIGRLIMYKECLKNNIMPFIVLDEKKHFYYRGLSEYKNEKGFLLDTCLLMQDIYKEIVQKYIGDLLKNNN